MTENAPENFSPSQARAAVESSMRARDRLDDWPPSQRLRVAQAHADRAVALWSVVERLCESSGVGADPLAARAPALVAFEASGHNRRTIHHLELIVKEG